MIRQTYKNNFFYLVLTLSDCTVAKNLVFKQNSFRLSWSTETSASSLNFIYVNGGGSKDKKGRKKEKEGRGFGRLPSFLFPPFLFFSKFFCNCDFGPNLVVFFLLFWGFDYFRILEIFNCDFVWTLREIRVRGMRVRVQV